MNLCFIPFLFVNRWLVGKGVIFALLGMLALDGGFTVTSAFAEEIGGLPSTLAFSGTVGGANPTTQTFALTNFGGGTLSWTASDGATWLQLIPNSGTTTTETDIISASVATSGLAAGTYNSFIAVTAPGAPSSPRYIPVSLTLTAATTAPAIGLNQTSLGFAGTVGGTNPSAQTIAVSNVGSGTLSWAASDNAGWLVLSPLSGINNGTMTANVNLTGLAAGTYNTAITVTAPGATTKTVPVTLTLTAAALPPAIGLSQTSLGFAGTVGGTNPSAQSIAISNVGSGTLSWAASDNTPWLTLSPASGTNSGIVTATVNLTGLGAGTYSTAITVTASGASTKTVPVTLTVGPGGSAGGFTLSPSSMSYTGTVGGPNMTTGVTITNSGSTNLTVSWRDNIDWLVDTSGDTVTMPPGGSAQIIHTASASKLSAGTYTNTATISGGGVTKQVPITMTLATSNTTPTIGLSPTSLTFTAAVGGTNPAAKPIAISNSGTGTLTWTASDNTAWLTLSPASGTNNGTVNASVNLTGLAAGTYNTAVTVTAPGATTKTVPVTLTLTAAALPPAIGLSPISLTFTGAAGGTNPAAQTFAVSNTGSGTLSWAASDSAGWLVLSPMSGTNNGSVTASVNLTGLAAGTHSTTITVTATGATAKTIPVTLTLTAATPTPSIGLNTTSLGFAGTVGGTNPTAQTIAVSNVGGGTLSWTASENAAWLALSPTSGTNSGIVTASVNLTGLAVGTYNATVTVSASVIPAKTLPVTLTITATTAGATIGFSPTSLTFTGTVGGTNPAAKPISISNTGGGTLSWTASDNTAWLALNPASGTNSGTVTASVNMTGLAAGTYNGIITVTASGSTNSPRQIPVSFTLSATMAGTATLAWNASTESDLSGYKVYRGTGSGTYGAPLATLPKTTTSYTATGLQNGTTYFFVITAYDSSDNESTYSNEVSKSIF